MTIEVYSRTKDDLKNLVLDNLILGNIPYTTRHKEPVENSVFTCVYLEEKDKPVGAKSFELKDIGLSTASVADIMKLIDNAKYWRPAYKRRWKKLY